MSGSRHEAAPPLRLNLGCGLEVVEGYRNLDNSPALRIRDSAVLRIVAGAAERLCGRPLYTRFPVGVRRFDVDRRWPFDDQSVEVIYSSHMLEHLARDRAEAFLRRAHRALVPRGRLRLALPDLERLAREYLLRVQGVRESDVQEIPSDAFMRSALLGTVRRRSLRRPLDLVRSVLSRDAHLWMWDGPSLAMLCRRVGFAEASERRFRESSIPEIDRLDVASREAESCYVEAVK